MVGIAEQVQVKSDRFQHVGNVNAELPEDDTGASNFKKLPTGWKLGIKTLDKDCIEVPVTGVATIMPDEFFSVYDKAGPGMSNFRPSLSG